jgi:tetratricopeptide (TPR) repeat protein
MNQLRKIFLMAAVLYAPQLFSQTYAEGLRAMQLEKWDDAVRIFTKLTSANPQDIDSWLSLGSAYVAKGEKDKAAQAYKTVSQAGSMEGPKAFVINARVAILNNDMTTADKEIERAARYGKKESSVFRFLGETFLYAGPNEKPNYTRAMEYLRKGYDINSRDFDNLMSLGYAFKEQSNGGQAAQYYEYASNAQDKNPFPLFMIGRVYKIAKLPQKSIEYYNRAIAIDPKFSLALRAKAEYYYFEERKYDEAVKAYKDLVTFSDHVEIDDEQQYANTLFLVRNYKECIQQVEKVIKLDNTKTYLRRLLGYCYYETGDFKQGLDVMNNYFKVVEKDKVLGSDYLYLGNLRLKTGGDTLQAIQDLKKAIEIDPQRWELYKDIGDLSYKIKSMCAAGEAYGIRLDSMEATQGTIQPLDYYYKGLSWYYCKDDTTKAHYEKALAAFLKVTEKAPNSGIGWFWSGKASAQLDPDLTVDTTQTARDAFGKAHDFFEKYVTIGEAGDINKEKGNLISAYGYLLYYHFIKQEDDEALRLAEKLLVLSPSDEQAMKIRDAILEQRKAAGGGGK